MKIGLMVAATFGIFAIHMSSVAEEKPHAKSLPDVLGACKGERECKDATTAEEAHECAEKKGRLNKGFRKSNCWEVNEEYEKAIAEARKAKP